MNRQYTEQIRNLQAELQQLLATDVATLNALLKQQNLPAIAATAILTDKASEESLP